MVLFFVDVADADVSESIVEICSVVFLISNRIPNCDRFCVSSIPPCSVRPPSYFRVIVVGRASAKGSTWEQSRKEERVEVNQSLAVYLRLEDVLEEAIDDLILSPSSWLKCLQMRVFNLIRTVVFKIVGGI